MHCFCTGDRALGWWQRQILFLLAKNLFHICFAFCFNQMMISFIWFLSYEPYNILYYHESSYIICLQWHSPPTEKQTARSTWIHTGDSDKYLVDKKQKRIKQPEQKISFRVKKKIIPKSGNLVSKVPELILIGRIYCRDSNPNFCRSFTVIDSWSMPCLKKG